MRGNSHVRFLGDLGGVIRPGYPPADEYRLYQIADFFKDDG